jgi:hypothetical protein
MEGILKFKKYMIIIFLLLSSNIHSQYLEIEDINRFSNFFHFFCNNYTASHLQGYYWSISFLNGCLFNIFNDPESKIEYNVQVFNDVFDTIFNGNSPNSPLEFIPDEIEKEYNSVGWTKNGHKIFLTIYFGSIYIQLEKDINKVKSMLEEGYLEVEDDRILIDEDEKILIKEMINKFEYIFNIINNAFNENDLNILRNDTEFVETLVNIIVSYNYFNVDILPLFEEHEEY